MSKESRSPGSRSVVSAVLNDGTIVETLYDPVQRRTSFLTSSGDQLATRASFEVAPFGRVVPFSPTNNLISHGVVLLPSGAEEYGATPKLLAHVQSFIHRYADLSPGFEELASHYVLLTWVYDAFNEVPYLRLRGDFGSGKSRCLQTIGSICYKPMMASGASTVSPLFRIIDAFRGTLVIDESDFRFSDEKAEIIKILNNGNTAGFPVLRCDVTPEKEFNPRAFNVFGPKIIATRGLFEDGALESRCLTEIMSGLPPRPEIPLNLPPSFHGEALELRNQLLMYRCRRVMSVQGKGEWQDVRLDARVRQLYAPLLVLAEDSEAAMRLRALAELKSRTLVSERGASVEAQLLDIMFRMRTAGMPLMVKDIALRFQTEFAGEFSWPITARWVGSQLRGKLGVTPIRRRGNFVIADDDPRLASLFERYQTDRSTAH